ncbi:MAG: hypothetical protein J3Q66DRAFT_336927 [Benniella sp.]|nr:MAG: hypothetical protein J3Q66DRAFT_336927 [Benniella sp.]
MSISIAPVDSRLQISFCHAFVIALQQSDLHPLYQNCRTSIPCYQYRATKKRQSFLRERRTLAQAPPPPSQHSWLFIRSRPASMYTESSEDNPLLTQLLVLPLLIARLIVATLTHPLAHYRHTHCSHHTFKRERHCQCMFVQLSFGSCLACLACLACWYFQLGLGSCLACHQSTPPSLCQ